MHILWWPNDGNTIYVGAPKLLRCDLGTENSRLAYLQPFLRRGGSLSDQSFQYGKSVSNQVSTIMYDQLDNLLL